MTKGATYLSDAARFGNLSELPEGENLGQVVTDTMKAIEAKNSDLKSMLPKSYTRLDICTLADILKTFSSVPVGLESDVFSR